VATAHMQLPFTRISYQVREGPLPEVFNESYTLSSLMDHMVAIYRGLRGAPQFKPDLVVGHMSFGTMLFLRNLYPCPFIGYFEMLPGQFWGEGVVLRKEYPPPEEVRLFNATAHAFTYLHLHACDACYTPTRFQLSTAPKELQYKLRVIFDGIDCNYFQRRSIAKPIDFHGRTLAPDTRIVTYVSRGLESARGFDIFMKVAK